MLVLFLLSTKYRFLFLPVIAKLVFVCVCVCDFGRQLSCGRGKKNNRKRGNCWRGRFLSLSLCNHTHTQYPRCRNTFFFFPNPHPSLTACEKKLYCPATHCLNWSRSKKIQRGMKEKNAIVFVFFSIGSCNLINSVHCTRLQYICCEWTVWKIG